MTDPMDYQTAFGLFKAQSSAADELWKFYATVALALLAAAVSSDKFKSSRQGVLMILAGFWAFSLGNLVALLQVQAVVVKLGEMANHIAQCQEQTSSIVLYPTGLCALATFHLARDIGLTAAIYLVCRKSWSAPA